jgi:hypothetical protein
MGIKNLYLAIKKFSYVYNFFPLVLYVLFTYFVLKYIFPIFDLRNWVSFSGDAYIGVRNKPESNGHVIDTCTSIILQTFVYMGYKVHLVQNEHKCFKVFVPCYILSILNKDPCQICDDINRVT